HIGSWKTDDEEPEDDAHYEHLIASIETVLAETDGDAKILIENMGTRKIGKDLGEVGRIIKDLDGHERLGVCLDTCHLHAAGFDLSTTKSYDEFFVEFDEQIGLERLAVVHVNDSRDDLGSLRDRHDNIGEGSVGEAVFKNIVTKSPTKDLPLILETPGFGGGGPDAKNIERLRSYAN
ncbi:MAG: deoxyribonuclease IV, partial [Candidatus Paceibacterota bacterium]